VTQAEFQKDRKAPIWGLFYLRLNMDRQSLC
jgi:hypothetical protein